MANEDLISPRFYVEAIKDEKASREAGRPIFKDVEQCEIHFAADRQRVVSLPAHDPFERDPATNEWTTPAQKFAPIYQKFKLDPEGLHITGTPLAELPFLTAAKRAELKALNIHTAEALAQLDGPNMKALGIGGRDLKNQAKAYIDKASGSADVTRLAAENAAMSERLAELERQNAELIATKGGKVAKPAKKSDEPSPFADWETADIKAWLKDSTGSDPTETTHEALVARADEVNAELAEQAKAA